MVARDSAGAERIGGDERQLVTRRINPGCMRDRALMPPAGPTRGSTYHA